MTKRHVAQLGTALRDRKQSSKPLVYSGITLLFAALFSQTLQWLLCSVIYTSLNQYLPSSDLHVEFISLNVSLSSQPTLIMVAQDYLTSQEVHLLPLSDDGAPNVSGEYIYLKAPTDPAYLIRFEIEGTSSICRQGCLWINIPEPGKPFRRDVFRKYEWVT